MWFDCLLIDAKSHLWSVRLGPCAYDRCIYPSKVSMSRTRLHAANCDESVVKNRITGRTVGVCGACGESSRSHSRLA